MDLETDIRFGDFQILNRLGAGGMGVVYKARQVSLDRIVALKVLGSALNRESDIARFQREAQAIAKLDHPGIAGVHFIGQDDRVCYMAMEFIDGASLRDAIDHLSTTRDASQTLASVLLGISAANQNARVVRFDQPTETHVSRPDTPSEATPHPPGLTPEARKIIASPSYIRRCVEMVRDAALALSHAHGRGVIHRDIKPENLLIDHHGKISVIDFGIARFFEDMTLTGTGMLVGTPLYMSPEQVTGRLEVDHRADIYALGLVLYELLTLQRPIEAPNRDAVLRQIVTKAMVPVCRRNRAVPRDLEGIVHKAMAKDPEERYQNASEFVADLGRWRAGMPVSATPYHYKFDRRQLIAERPLGATLVSFSYIAYSLISFAFYITILVPRLFHLSQLTGHNAINGWDIGLTGCLTILVPLGLWIGQGILVASPIARRMARLMLVVVFSLVMIPLIIEIGQSIRTKNIQLRRYIFRMSNNARVLDLYYGQILVPSFPLLAFTPVLLLRRSTHEWFRLADHLRAEHEEKIT